MAVVLVVFCVFCLITKDQASQADTDGDEIVIDLEKILGMDTSVKSVNALSYEEEYGIAYFEGTSAEDFAGELCGQADGAELTSSWQEDDLLVSVYSNDLYYIYVESDTGTDEIHYFQISIFDWEEAGENADIFTAAMELLGYEYICENDEEGKESVSESLEGYVQEINDGNLSFTSIIVFDSSCVEFFTDESGYPTCEVLAY